MGRRQRNKELDLIERRLNARPIACSYCNSGLIFGSTCTMCKGTGRVVVAKNGKLIAWSMYMMNKSAK